MLTAELRGRVSRHRRVAQSQRPVRTRLGRQSLLFWRSERGLAAIEFALIAPVIILLYVGAGELAQAVMTNRRMETLSRTLVDVVSQQPTSTQTSSTPAPGNATAQAALQSIFNASLAVMAPSPATSLTMTVSAVDIVGDPKNGYACCLYNVRWSYTQSGSLRPCNISLTPVSPTQPPSPTTISNAMIPPVSVLTTPIPILIADVSYTYTGPFASSWLTFPVSMKRTSYMLPRLPGQVIAAAPLSTIGNQSGTICY